jgi:hypothetical protein
LERLLLDQARMNLEISLEEDDEWLEERTSRIDFDRPALTPEAKLVFGYLTMEQHGIFADLPLEEQQQIANTLKR